MLAPGGALLIADVAGHLVCELLMTGKLRVVAGGAAGSRDGKGTEASFRIPSDVAVGQEGTCYVADTGNDWVPIMPDGTVAALAGSNYDFGDGRGRSARFRQPEGISAALDGGCYVADTGTTPSAASVLTERLRRSPVRR